MEKNLTEELVEKTVKAVKTRSPKKKSVNKKICKVLSYDERNKSMDISFDGYGYEIKNVLKNPGNEVEIYYTGNINSENFKMEYRG